MKANKSSLIKYKRRQVEISGEAREVKKHIWFEQINSLLLWLVPVIVLLIFLPKASWLPLIWQWLKKQISLLIFFVVLVLLLPHATSIRLFSG